MAGEKALKDMKKPPAAGKVGDTSEKDKLATAGKPVDVKKSHEAENVKSTMDTGLSEQGDGCLDDRSLTCISFWVDTVS